MTAVAAVDGGRRGWRWKKSEKTGGTVEAAISSLDLDNVIYNLWRTKPNVSDYRGLKLKMLNIRANLPIDEDETKETQKEEEEAKTIKTSKVYDVIQSLSIYHNLGHFRDREIIQHTLDKYQNFFELIGQDDDTIYQLQLRGFDLTKQRDYDHYLPFIRVYPDHVVDAVGTNMLKLPPRSNRLNQQCADRCQLQSPGWPSTIFWR